jgi:hypothetical protein
MQRRTSRAAHDLAGKQIHDNCQIQPALSGSNIGNVGDPSYVRERHRELPLQRCRTRRQPRAIELLASMTRFGSRAPPTARAADRHGRSATTFSIA